VNQELFHRTVPWFPSPPARPLRRGSVARVNEQSAAAAAGTWQLGDLTVNRLGFGAMRLTGSVPFGKGTPSDRAQSIAVLRRAVDLGVNHIDTAAFYFSPLRSANELINTALAPYPADLVITTKVGPGRDTWGDWQSARPDQLRGQVEENLRQLGRDYLEVVNLRRAADQESISEHFGALAELRQAGLVRHLGLSGVNPAQLAEAKSLTTVGVAAVPKGVSPQIAATIADVTHATFISGMTAAFLVASVVAVGGALIALLTKKGAEPAHYGMSKKYESAQITDMEGHHPEGYDQHRRDFLDTP